MKNRSILPFIQQAEKKPLGRILVLTGARQTGKTTLARHCFPKYSYLAIEDPVMRGQYANLAAAQWALSFPRAILDEIQKEPRLIESIKAVYDQFPKPRYVLLGSSQLLLLQKVKESLAGRCLIVEVFPLTLPELMSKGWDEAIAPSLFIQLIMSNDNSIPQNLRPSFLMDSDYARKMEAFNFYLKFGGYPALVNPEFSDDHRYEWLSQYIRTYLERDVRDLAEFKNLQPFITAQRISSLNTAQQLNFSQLAKETGISAKTAQKFINYLEISFQVLLLQPWHRNLRKRLVKSPKLHYLDIGVQQAIIGKRGGTTGHEFESAIFAEIYKQLKIARVPVSLFYLRTFDGKEVDLLIESEKDYVAIEIKMTANVNASDAKHLLGLDDILDKPLRWGFILSNDPQVKQLSQNTYAIPAAMILT